MAVIWRIRAIAACTLRRDGLGAVVWAELFNVTVGEVIRNFMESIKLGEVLIR